MSGPKGGRAKIGRSPLDESKPQTFDEWMAGTNEEKFVKRRELLSFATFWVKTQIAPLIGSALVSFEAEMERKAKHNRWYRRLGRWLKGFFVKPGLEVADLPPEARAELRAELDAAEEVPAPEPAEAPEKVRTCVTCGSAELEPITEEGGLRCPKGHIVEEPPPEVDDGTRPEPPDEETTK